MVVPNRHGEQPNTPGTQPGPKAVLLLAGVCGAVSGYLAHDWKTGAEVFAVVVVLFADRR
jgi:hypothetical protein